MTTAVTTATSVATEAKDLSIPLTTSSSSSSNGMGLEEIKKEMIKKEEVAIFGLG
jgi:hypothetical protein